MRTLLPIALCALSGVAALGCEFHAGTRAGAQAAPPPAPAPGPAPAAAPAPAPTTPAGGPRHVTVGGGPSTTPATASSTPATTAPHVGVATSVGRASGGMTSVVHAGKGVSVPVQSGENVFGTGSEASDSIRGILYFLPEGTQRLPDFSTLQPKGALFTKSFNIAPRDFREGFPGIDSRFEWFAIRYEGTFNVAKAGTYSFRLISDDGANVFIDDTKQIDNDGLHGPSGGAKPVSLTAGAHKIRVEYFQGPRFSVALQLFVAAVDQPEKPFTTSF